jgi:hypothetical protein
MSVSNLFSEMQFAFLFKGSPLLETVQTEGQTMSWNYSYASFVVPCALLIPVLQCLSHEQI